jgi:hypothetical protein
MFATITCWQAVSSTGPATKYNSRSIQILCKRLVSAPG